MGKRLIQQARGKGSLTYRVKKKAFKIRVCYPKGSGKGEIIKLIHSPAHSAPLAKIKVDKETFFIPAFNQAFVEQKIEIGDMAKPEAGNILPLKKITQGTEVYNIERNPGDGGKMIRTAGSAATILKILENNSIVIAMPNKKQITLHPNCRATIGRIAGDGRILKPFVTAGKKFHKMKAKSKLWPRTSAVKMNAIDHPMGSGRGKNVGAKIVQRNASPGQKVGHIRPRRTGKKK
jgi:large subunit ribosomal protein L2